MSKKIYLILALICALKLASAQNSSFNKLKDQAVKGSNSVSVQTSNDKNKKSTTTVTVTTGNAVQTNQNAGDHKHHKHNGQGVCPYCKNNNGQYHKALNEERKKERKEEKEEHKHHKHGKGHDRD